MNAERESVETVLIEALGQWTKWYDADVSETNEGRVYYLHHTLSKKWSVFLKNFLEHVMSELLSLHVPIEMTENSVIFTMPKTSKPFNKQHNI
jgi:tagatose-1,6-bisphosphate aldolase non-catalytic subunit AgaZ/GatZ